jgi:hypothetical protein
MIFIYLTFFSLLSVGSELYRMMYPDSFEEMTEICEKKINNIKHILQPVLLDVGYKSIYIYSSCQIYVDKTMRIAYNTYNNIEELLGYLGLIHKEIRPECTFEIYKDGNLEEKIAIFKHSENFDIDKQLKNCESYDLILIYDNNGNIKSIDKLCNIEFPTKMLYAISNVKFIAIELIYNDNNYEIQLKTETHNYYVDGTVLNRNFLKYYLKNVLKVNPINDSFDYTLVVIDHNANMMELKSDQTIIIKENDYEIK